MPALSKGNAMARSKASRGPQQPPPIQFRPGPLLGRRIAEFAAAWGLTQNEAAKRLAAITVYRIDLAWYPLLQRLAEAVRPPVGGVADFPAACDRIRAVL